jgi:hypothetical protein
MEEKHQKIVGFVALAEFVAAAGIILFWISYFFVKSENIMDAHLRDIYHAFESAFPIADSWLVATLIIGGIGLLKNKNYGILFTLLAGSALIFLGLVDASFNLQQGIYGLGTGEAVMNVSVNGLCLAAGIVFVTITWKRAWQR